MSDAAIKQRMMRAKRKAATDLERLGLHVVPSNNAPVCMVAIDAENRARLIRICLDQITAKDRSAFRKRFPRASAEIWLRKAGTENFEIYRL